MVHIAVVICVIAIFLAHIHISKQFGTQPCSEQACKIINLFPLEGGVINRHLPESSTHPFLSTSWVSYHISSSLDTQSACPLAGIVEYFE
jgi:hypothetical protein